MNCSIDTSLNQFRNKGDRYPLNDSDTIMVLYHESDGFLASVRIDKSDVYVDESRVVYSKDGKILISFFKHEEELFEHDKLVNYKVKEGTEIICDSAFCFCKNLREIIIPDSVRAIGRGAFWGCDSLSSIKLPCGLEIIREKTFWGCRSLRSIKMPESLKRIEDNAYEFCGSLSFIFLAQNVEYVAPTAFNTGTVYPSQIIVPNLTGSYYSEILKDSKVIVKTIDEFNVNQVGQETKGMERKSWVIMGFVVFLIINILIVGGIIMFLSMFKSCVS